MTISNIFGRTIPLSLYTDSKSLHDGIVGLNATTEKRLLIDLRMLRESYELRELKNIAWISSSRNPAEAMTKESHSPGMDTLLADNHLDVHAHSWVERKTEPMP